MNDGQRSKLLKHLQSFCTSVEGITRRIQSNLSGKVEDSAQLNYKYDLESTHEKMIDAVPCQMRTWLHFFLLLLEVFGVITRNGHSFYLERKSNKLSHLKKYSTCKRSTVSYCNGLERK